MPKNNRAAPLHGSATDPAHGVAEMFLLKTDALQNAILNSASISLIATDTNGIIVMFLNHEVATEEVIRWADMAMYQAKEAGGNSIRFSET